MAILVIILLAGLLLYLYKLQEEKKSLERFVQDQEKVSNELLENPIKNINHQKVMSTLKDLEKVYKDFKIVRVRHNIILASGNINSRFYELNFGLIRDRIKLVYKINHERISTEKVFHIDDQKDYVKKSIISIFQEIK